MDRIGDLFRKKKQHILNVYCTAGFPALGSTIEVMQALEESGADMIELGMPYSDPLADGPVIQASGTKAIANGMTISTLFRNLERFREAVQVPVILMGYMNPVLQYGFERFCKEAAACGIDGLILPDLPLFEFENEYRAVIEKYQLNCIFLVTPETPAERVKKIDSLSTGFLYAVSSSSITGTDKKMEDQSAYFARLSGLGLRNPVLVGFGIKDRQSFEAACTYCAGAIIGTAYIRAIENAADIRSATKALLMASSANKNDVVILRYNAGNIRSVLYALERIGMEATVSDDHDQIRNASKVIFPGVGEASTAMAYLKERRLDEVIRSLTQPVLGICLGMQLLCKYSEENNTECLGIFDETVRLFHPGDAHEKVPQIGWNNIYDLKTDLFEGIRDQTYIYSVHSYYAETGPHTIARANYIHPYSAALKRENFYGVQFHPEKSAKAGEQILKNFLEHRFN